MLFCITWNDHVGFWFLLYWYSISVYIDYEMLSQPWIPGINPTWLWYIIIFICCQVWFASIFLEDFAYVLMRYWSVLFSYDIWFWYLSKNRLKKVSPLYSGAFFFLIICLPWHNKESPFSIRVFYKSLFSYLLT